MQIDNMHQGQAAEEGSCGGTDSHGNADLAVQMSEGIVHQKTPRAARLHPGALEDIRDASYHLDAILHSSISSSSAAVRQPVYDRG
jgi:hypothetical protein